ncbi:MAG: GTPase HflX, partial [Candidatus Omnitrophica bacterium]|nr:GTPase HflX [Candidatus Omnitrophota bacterium]
MPQIKSPAYHFPDRSGPKDLGTPFQRIVVAQLLDPEVTSLEAEDRLEEITRLVETLDGKVVGTISQRKKIPHPEFCFGPGKAEKTGKLCEEVEADTVVFDAPLTPNQISSLEYETGSHVMDRTELILEIFARRAKSSESKLQVELAYLDYIHPKMGKDKQPRAYRGGVRGFAESALDKKIRAARSRADVVRKKIEKLKKQKESRIQRRDDRPTVALVGYTNAGKSTLLNALSSGDDVYADDRLFATLDTTTRRVFLNQEKFALVSDTVGFIRRLPHELVASFHSTLSEALSAKLLVHVADASSPILRHQMEAVEQTLTELGAGDRNLLLVFNKIDAAQADDLEYLRDRYPEAVHISAMKKTGFDQLREAFL